MDVLINLAIRRVLIHFPQVLSGLKQAFLDFLDLIRILRNDSDLSFTFINSISIRTNSFHVVFLNQFFLSLILFQTAKWSNGQTSAGVQLDTDQRFVKQLYVHSEVCYIRLDLESFTILGPATNAEPSGGICVDSFAVTVSQ